MPTIKELVFWKLSKFIGLIVTTWKFRHSKYQTSDHGSCNWMGIFWSSFFVFCSSYTQSTQCSFSSRPMPCCLTVDWFSSTQLSSYMIAEHGVYLRLLYGLCPPRRGPWLLGIAFLELLGIRDNNFSPPPDPPTGQKCEKRSRLFGYNREFLSWGGFSDKFEYFDLRKNSFCWKF